MVEIYLYGIAVMIILLICNFVSDKEFPSLSDLGECLKLCILWPISVIVLAVLALT